MPYIPVLGVVQAELVFNWDGQIVENVLHYENLTGFTLTELDELGAMLVSWWNTNLKAAMPTTISLVNVKLTDLTTQTGIVVNYATGLPLAGTGASPSLPNNVSVAMTKRTALRGRSYRGRVFHPGLVESVVTGSTVSSTHVASLITYYNALITLIDDDEQWDMVVVSRYTNKDPRDEGVATLVTNFTCDGIVDSQRRRLPRRGQ